jgi:hypothetical protein
MFNEVFNMGIRMLPSDEYDNMKQRPQSVATRKLLLQRTKEMVLLR